MQNFKWSLLIVGLLLGGCNVALETSDSGFYLRKQTVNVDGNLKNANQEQVKQVDPKKAAIFSLGTLDKSHKATKSKKIDQFTLPKFQKEQKPLWGKQIELDSIRANKENSLSSLYSTYFHKNNQSETASSIGNQNPFFGIINFFMKFLALVFLISAIALILYAANYGVSTPGFSLILASYLLLMGLLLLGFT